MRHNHKAPCTLLLRCQDQPSDSTTQSTYPRQSCRSCKSPSKCLDTPAAHSCFGKSAPPHSLGGARFHSSQHISTAGKEPLASHLLHFPVPSPIREHATSSPPLLEAVSSAAAAVRPHMCANCLSIPRIFMDHNCCVRILHPSNGSNRESPAQKETSGTKNTPHSLLCLHTDIYLSVPSPTTQHPPPVTAASPNTDPKAYFMHGLQASQPEPLEEDRPQVPPAEDSPEESDSKRYSLDSSLGSGSRVYAQLGPRSSRGAKCRI